jgi:predicted glutamine amidotransferase
MCQLLALNCLNPTDASFSFTGFARRGGLTADHTDGWGMAFFEGKGLRMFVDHESAATSPVATFLRQYPIKSRNIIAHVRKATSGDVRLENVHPFSRELWGRNWVFAHNGHLTGFTPQLHGSFTPVGQTDSELAFCWLLQELAKSHAALPNVQELSLTLEELIPQISRHGTFNVVLSNGEALWAHGSTHLHHLERAYPFGRATLSDDDWQMDFAQHTTPDDRVAVVVTAPLTADEVWTAFKPHELKVFAGGALVQAFDLGAAHARWRGQLCAQLQAEIDATHLRNQAQMAAANAAPALRRTPC